MGTRAFVASGHVIGCWSQGRVAILVVWFTFLTGVMLNALWSFHKSRSTVKAGEEPLAEHAWQTSQPAPTSGLRSVLQHRSLSVLDGRLLVRLARFLGTAWC